MAYNFTAEKHDELDLYGLRERLSKVKLIEFFTVERSAMSLVLGISIPYKAMANPGFKDEFDDFMNYLVSEQGFRVIDLFTGNAISSRDIPGLAQEISA